MEFVKQYNDATADKRGQVIPAVVTVYEDNTFTFITKLPPVAEMIKSKMGGKKGSGKAGREVAGKLTNQQLREIAEEKMADLNAYTVEAAMKVVAGTARSMGCLLYTSSHEDMCPDSTLGLSSALPFNRLSKLILHIKSVIVIALRSTFWNSNLDQKLLPFAGCLLYTSRCV